MKLLAATAALAVASGCSATPAPAAATGNAAVDAFVGDIMARRRDSALARIGTMESLTGLPNAAATPEQFVEKLLQCSYVSVAERGFGATKMYDLTWRCPDGDYRSLIDPDWRAPRLTVGQFQSAATLADWSRMGPAPPAPPPPPRRPGRPN